MVEMDELSLRRGRGVHRVDASAEGGEVHVRIYREHGCTDIVASPSFALELAGILARQAEVAKAQDARTHQAAEG